MRVEAEQVNSMLTMAEVWERYFVENIKRYYVHCPFHDEATASMRIYPHSFYCFGCGAGGDIIRFVQLYFDLDFMAAVIRLNYDFGLGLPVGEKTTARMRAEMRQKERERVERQRLRQERERAAQLQYQELWNEWIRLDINMRRFAPAGQTDNLHPLFVEAIHKIGYQEYLIDCLT